LSNNKKDLTRIEDLGEFIHELSVDDTSLGQTETDLPDLPFLEESPETDDPLDSEFPPDFNNEEEVEGLSGFESDSFLSDSDVFPEDFPQTTNEGTDGGTDEAIEETPYFPTTPEVTDLSHTPDTIFLREEKKQNEAIQTEYNTPENFEDVKNFSEISHFSSSSMEANPSFSVLIKNIHFLEDIPDVISLLKEFGLLTDSPEETRARLARGQLLIPRISEYTAIYLAHTLRRFDMEVELGLSELIHKPKDGEKPDVGIVSKKQLYQNHSHHFDFNHSKISLSDIRVVATSSMEGFEILHYLGVASEHKFIDGETLENEDSEEVLNLYQELANKLKAHALKANSNAVVGLTYQLTPLPSEAVLGRPKYRLSCTGNLVWVNKL